MREVIGRGLLFAGVFFPSIHTNMCVHLEIALLWPIIERLNISCVYMSGTALFVYYGYFLTDPCARLHTMPKPTKLFVSRSERWVLLFFASKSPTWDVYLFLDLFTKSVCSVRSGDNRTETETLSYALREKLWIHIWYSLSTCAQLLSDGWTEYVF